MKRKWKFEAPFPPAFEACKNVGGNGQIIGWHFLDKMRRRFQIQIGLRQKALGILFFGHSMDVQSVCGK